MSETYSCLFCAFNVACTALLAVIKIGTNCWICLKPAHPIPALLTAQVCVGLACRVINVNCVNTKKVTFLRKDFASTASEETSDDTSESEEGSRWACECNMSKTSVWVSSDRFSLAMLAVKQCRQQLPWSLITEMCCFDKHFLIFKFLSLLCFCVYFLSSSATFSCACESRSRSSSLPQKTLLLKSPCHTFVWHVRIDLA